MALQFISSESIPTYVALSTDIVSSQIAGAVLVGKTIFTTDDGKWYIIRKNLDLADYVLPVAFTGSVSVGDVSLLDGESHVGSIGGNEVIVNNTPTLTVHASYASGDYVGTSSTAMTFTNCARVNGGTGMISRAILADYALQSAAGELWLFDTAPTPPADSAAWTISDADASTCIGIIPFTTYYASALNSISIGVPSAMIMFKCGVSSRDLYGCFVTRGTPTYASGELTFRLPILQD